MKSLKIYTFFLNACKKAKKFKESDQTTGQYFLVPFPSDEFKLCIRKLSNKIND